MDTNAPAAPARKPGYESRNQLVVRGDRRGLMIRSAGEDDGPGTLYGHFAVFNRWVEIESFWEGRFMESIAPGAFARTIKNDRAGMKVTFNHGHDVLGDQILGPIETLSEDETGAYYEVPLYRGIPDLIAEGLRGGSYGASFRFRVMREETTEEPEHSDHNPDGIPERVIKEAQVMEFGPVTFPAYPDASADVRSLTDHYILQRFGTDPERLRELLEHAGLAHATALPHGHDSARSDIGTRDDSPPRLVVVRNPNRRR